MQRGAVATVIAVVGIALAGCNFVTNTRSSTTTTVRLPPGSTAAPLSPQDADMLAAVAAIPAGSCHARHVNVADPQAWEPDLACTPGATDAGLPVAQLCPVAHTKPIRPPAAYTDALKRMQMRAYGDTGSPAHFEEDHLIPLALGGAPRDPQNLWPEPHASPNEKDTVEGVAHDAVCWGRSRWRTRSIASPPTGTSSAKTSTSSTNQRTRDKSSKATKHPFVPCSQAALLRSLPIVCGRGSSSGSRPRMSMVFRSR
jgi:hypothetical protein